MVLKVGLIFLVTALYLLSTKYFYTVFLLEGSNRVINKADNVIVVDAEKIPYSWVDGLVKDDGEVALVSDGQCVSFSGDGHCFSFYANVREDVSVNIVDVGGVGSLNRNENFIIVYPNDEVCLARSIIKDEGYDVKYVTYLPSAVSEFVPDARYLSINISSVNKCNN